MSVDVVKVPQAVIGGFEVVRTEALPPHGYLSFAGVAALSIAIGH